MTESMKFPVRPSTLAFAVGDIVDPSSVSAAGKLKAQLKGGTALTNPMPPVDSGNTRGETPVGALKPHQLATESHKAQFEAALSKAKKPDPKKTLSPEQVERARKLLAEDPQRFGIPAKDETRYVFLSSNIRKLGNIEKKTAGAWRILADVFEHSKPDILNIQEVMDTTEGLELLKTALGPHFQMLYTDTTGGDHRVNPDGSTRRGGMKERLATLFDTRTVRQGQLAADLSFDRTAVVDALMENQHLMLASVSEFFADIAAWKQSGEKQGKKHPTYKFPDFFVDFTRTPSAYELVVQGKGGAEEKMLVVNAHMVYGELDQREEELKALVQSAMGYASKGHNVLLGGDLNLHLEEADAAKDLARIEGGLAALGQEALQEQGVAMNMPFLGEHPEHGLQTTNLRDKFTYDHIAMLSKNGAFPTAEENTTAGQGDYDFGVVRLDELFAEVIHGKPMAELTKAEKLEVYKRTEHDVTDHLPIWVRAKKPGY
ncbi:MAG: endonuclease/exonuclease/phosphatase family protein [Myxococcota bacterium]